MLRKALLLSCACVLALAPATASAAAGAELSVMDDQALLGRSQATVDKVLSRMQRLGADRLRVSAFWADIAPAPTALKKPAGFDSENPGDYRYRWRSLDRVVVSAQRHGLKVLVSISTPMPYWASTQPKRRNDVWRPNAGEYARFAYAVAARYAPYADQFALMNEPNQGAWLQPQSVNGKPVAPHLYRAYVRLGHPAVKRAAPNATVLIGELAPSGRDDPGPTRPIRPLKFMREMACVNTHFRPVRSGACKTFAPLPADAIGHHPYSVFRSPYQRSERRDDAALGDWRRLLSTVDKLVARKRITPKLPGRMQVFYTEYGYQTNPPDPFSGISLGRQSRWLQDAAYVAWRTPRVHAINQFRLTDGKLRGRGPLRYREFQSGLWFAGGKAKPASRTFPNPIVVRASGRSRLLVWGQARLGGAHSVSIERRAPGSKAFKAVASAQTDAAGYFQKRIARRSGAYRFRWSDAGGQGLSQAVSASR
jgi:hypothetical protein